MAKLSTALGGALSPEPLADIEAAVDLSNLAKGVELVVTPGACSPALGTSKLNVDATDAVTLADGTVVGQRKSIVITIGASTPIAVVTPANYADGTTITLTAVGASCTLEWDGTDWHTVGGALIAIA